MDDSTDVKVKIARAFRVPAWVLGIAPRPWWGARLVAWMRGYR